jgi:hypothetical protein
MDRATDIHRPDGSGEVVSTTQARQGVTSGHVRLILAISTALVVVAFVVIYFSMARSW